MGRKEGKEEGGERRERASEGGEERQRGGGRELGRGKIALKEGAVYMVESYTLLCVLKTPTKKHIWTSIYTLTSPLQESSLLVHQQVPLIRSVPYQ